MTGRKRLRAPAHSAVTYAGRLTATDARDAALLALVANSAAMSELDVTTPAAPPAPQPGDDALKSVAALTRRIWADADRTPADDAAMHDEEGDGGGVGAREPERAVADGIPVGGGGELGFDPGGLLGGEGT